MKLINGSAWTKIETEDLNLLCYFAGQRPYTIPESWHNHYTAFACVRYDLHSKTLTLWRDHFGLEPLYYYYESEQFIFGSSLPDIIKHLPQHPRLNPTRILIECFSADQANTPNYSNETFYTSIYRVEPGHCLTIQQGHVRSEPFWQLDPEAPSIHYTNDAEYLEHFSLLLNESVQLHTKSAGKLAAELSGGLDSSAIISSCHHLGLHPALFSHAAPKNRIETIDLPQIHCLLEQLKLTDVHYVGAEQFDPITVFNQLTPVFAGAPCYVFFMLANNIHQAVAQGGYTTLLSGFGGDECVSGYARNLSFYPELLHTHQYRKAWQEMTAQLQQGSTITPAKIKIFLTLLRYLNPLMFKVFSRLDDLKSTLKAYVTAQKPTPRVPGYPYHRTVKHFEHSQLQGRLSLHIRMRVEYSAVLAKHLGFRYAYPLLHPKLVEFCFHLPIEQKRRQGMGRYLIRQYLAQYLPKTISAHTSKRGDIMSATRHKYLEYLQKGKLDPYFRNLPFESQIHQIAASNIQPLAKILAYMIKRYCEEHSVQIPTSLFTPV